MLSSTINPLEGLFNENERALLSVLDAQFQRRRRRLKGAIQKGLCAERVVRLFGSGKLRRGDDWIALSRIGCMMQARSLASVSKGTIAIWLRKHVN